MFRLRQPRCSASSHYFQIDAGDKGESTNEHKASAFVGSINQGATKHFGELKSNSEFVTSRLIIKIFFHSLPWWIMFFVFYQ